MQQLDSLQTVAAYTFYRATRKLELVPSLTMEDIEQQVRTHVGADTHSVCAAYLGLQHATATLTSLASCEHYACPFRTTDAD